jgi:hypothetical protein
MRRLVGIATVVSLAACATMSPQREAALSAEAGRKVVCSGKDDCEVKWASAIRWVQDNSHWKMRNVTDSLVTTEGPFDSTYAAYQISKFPLGGGAYEIEFRAGCGNLFGCVPSILELTASFKSIVGSPNTSQRSSVPATAAAPAAPLALFTAPSAPRKAWEPAFASQYYDGCIKSVKAKYGAARTNAQLQYACECITWNLQDRYSFGEMYDASRSNPKPIQDAVVEISEDCKKMRPAELGPDPG